MADFGTPTAGSPVGSTGATGLVAGNLTGAIEFPVSLAGARNFTTLGAHLTWLGTQGIALTANPLSQFAPTTSAQLAGIISDKTGTGAMVFANGPTLGVATFAGAPRTSGSASYFAVQTPADTTLTASTEAPGMQFGGDASLASVTRKFAAGNITTQRGAIFVAPTYSAVGASTITNAATVAITGAPAAGANVTITNPYALWVQGGLTELDGGLQVTALAGTKKFIIMGDATGADNALEAQTSGGVAYVKIGPPSNATPWVNIAGTLSTSQVFATALNLPLTTAGSSTNWQLGIMCSFGSGGYTGTGNTIAGQFQNGATGTGVGFTGSSGSNAYSPLRGNFALFGKTYGTTVGNNYGVQGLAKNGLYNFGVWGSSTSGNPNAFGFNVGVAGFALNTGATPTHCAGYFALADYGGGAPPIANAAVIADNGGTSSPVFLGRVNGTTNFTIDAAGNVKLGVQGNKLFVKEGGGISAMGTGTLSSGTATISTTAVTASSRIFLSDQGGGILANIGSLSSGTVVAGTSFVVNSSNALDSSNFAWLIIEPA